MKKSFLSLFLILCALMFGGCTMTEQQPLVSSESSLEVTSSQEESVLEESSLLPEESTTLPEDVVEENGPRIFVDKTVYQNNDTITVTFAKTNDKDWVGFYPYGTEPGTINSLVWQYAVGERSEEHTSELQSR